ncbi:MAG: hypothetical protein AVDCRST_MAG65-1280, partial [uncultured Solirubrobacteraceae bacterium]
DGDARRGDERHDADRARQRRDGHHPLARRRQQPVSRGRRGGARRPLREHDAGRPRRARSGRTAAARRRLARAGLAVAPSRLHLHGQHPAVHDGRSPRRRWHPGRRLLLRRQRRREHRRSGDRLDRPIARGLQARARLGRMDARRRLAPGPADDDRQQSGQRRRPRGADAHPQRGCRARLGLRAHHVAQLPADHLAGARHAALADRRLGSGPDHHRLRAHLGLHLGPGRRRRARIGRRRRLPRRRRGLRRLRHRRPLAVAHHHDQPQPARQGGGLRRRAHRRRRSRGARAHRSGVAGGLRARRHRLRGDQDRSRRHPHGRLPAPGGDELPGHVAARHRCGEVRGPRLRLRVSGRRTPGPRLRRPHGQPVQHRAASARGAVGHPQRRRDHHAAVDGSRSRRSRRRRLDRLLPDLPGRAGHPGSLRPLGRPVERPHLHRQRDQRGVAPLLGHLRRHAPRRVGRDRAGERM